MADEIKIELVLDEDGMIKGLKKVEKDAEDAGENIGDGLANGITAKQALIGGAVAAAIGGAAVIAAAVKLKDALETVVDAAIVQDEAVQKLNNSLITTGQYTADTSKDLQAFASQLQSTSKYGDEANIAQMAFAQSMGATAEQSKLVLSAAADMATALDMDLNSAVRNISKSLGGYAGELGEVIPELKALSKEQLMAGDGIDIIAKKFEGFAELQTKTFAGAMNQASMAFGDMQEKMGKSVVESDALIFMINTATKALVTMTTKINFDFLVKGIMMAAKGMAKFLENLGYIGMSIAKLVGNESLKSFFVEAKDAARGFRFEVEKMTPEILAQNAAQREQANEQKSRLVELARVAAAKAEQDKILAAEESKRKDAALAELQKQEDAIVNFNKTVKSAMLNGVVSAFGAFGNALGSGGNAFEDFGKTVLSALGGLAMQIGAFFIAVGAGMSATTMFLGLSGGAAIAAGLALTVLGGALQGMAGKGGSSSSVTSSAVGGGEATTSSTLTTDTGVADLNESESREKQQSVQLVVHGDVLDSDETGTRLLNILNENFESSGGRLITA